MLQSARDQLPEPLSGALAADLENEDLALVAFWRDAALLKPLHTHRAGTRLLDDLMRIPAKGLTNVHFALTVGLAELARSNARQHVAILLSDSVHNAGPDPRLVAPRFSRLHGPPSPGEMVEAPRATGSGASLSLVVEGKTGATACLYVNFGLPARELSDMPLIRYDAETGGPYGAVCTDDVRPCSLKRKSGTMRYWLLHRTESSRLRAGATWR